MKTLLLSLLTGLTSFASAQTLIVTHADLRYDESASAGPATRELLLDTSFNRKWVLIADGGERRFTFNPSGLSYESYPSFRGDIEWPFEDDHFVVAGGYSDVCLQQTVWDLVTRSTKDTYIRVVMAASCNFLGRIVEDPYVIDRTNPVLNLNTIEKLVGTQAFARSLTNYFAGWEKEPTLGAQVQIQLRGKTVGRFGNGHRIVTLDFR